MKVLFKKYYYYFTFSLFFLTTFLSNSQTIFEDNNLTDTLKNTIKKTEYFLQKQDLDSLLIFSNKLSKIGVNTDSKISLFYANLYKGKLNLIKKNSEKAILFLEKASEISNYNDSLLIKNGVYSNLRDLYYENNSINKYLTTLLRIDYYYKNSENFTELNQNLIYLGEIFIENENFGQAKLYLEKVIENCKKETIENENEINAILGKVYISKAFLNYSMGDFQKSLEYSFKSEVIFKKLNFLRKIEVVKCNRGNMYIKLNRLDEAEEIYLNSLNQTQFPKIVLEAKLCLYSISLLRNETSEFKNAHKNLINDPSLSAYYKFETLIEISKIYLKKEMYNESLASINSCLDILKTGMFKQRIRTLNLKSIILEKMNLSNDLIKNLKEISRIKDVLDEKKSEFQLNYLKTKLMLTDLNNEINEQNLRINYLAEKNKIKTLLNGLSILLIVIVIIFSFFYVSKSKKSKEKELELMEVKDRYRKKQVTDFALYLDEKNTILNEINHKIKYSNINFEVKKDINMYIQNKISYSNSKIDLEKASNEINKDFYKKISFLHPVLTEKEKELLYLIRLNYSSKQICEVLNIEKATVNNYRYRLRKKINLDKGHNLTSYVHSI
jgi:DNA-binding CsgD family transcriptional regulator